MGRFIQTIVAIGSLSLLANAQEKAAEEPNYARVLEPPTAQSLAARAAGIRVAWIRALGAAHQIAASQGYRRRDTHWSAELPSEGFTIVPLQLYAGNDYYIVLGTDSPSDNIAASAFDPDRMLIKSTPDRGEGKLVLHVTPKKSGVHYLRLHQKAASKKPTLCALTYIYR